MNGRSLSGIMLTLLLIGMLTFAFNIQPVKASGTIYIRPDGSVEGTDKIQRDADLYTFTDNIYDKIVVERDNIVVDGAGYTLQGTGWKAEIGLSGRSNVTIKNTKIHAHWIGISLGGSSNNIISGNNITGTPWGMSGIHLGGSSNNIISGNNITGTPWGMSGIYLGGSNNNSVFDNYITENSGLGIPLWSSDYNSIYGNTVTDNDCAIKLDFSNHNNVYENTVTDNNLGLDFFYSSSNSIHGNNIERNWWYGIAFTYSSDNIIYHNDFVHNAPFNPGQAYSYGSTNVWDDSYPSGGNYWSDHVTVDDCCGINQDEIGSDGIVDEPYTIDIDNRDNYPLIEPWTLIDGLKAEVEELGSEGEIDNQGIVKSLIAKLNVAQKLVDKGKTDEAKSILEEDFIPQVQNLSGIHITVEVADILIESAEHILSYL